MTDRPPLPPGVVVDREFLFIFVRRYEALKDIGPLREERRVDEREYPEPADAPGYSARQRGADQRRDCMQTVHRAWQNLHETDAIGIAVNPDTATLEGPFLAYVQALWMEAGFEPPPARTIRKLITGF